MQSRIPFDLRHSEACIIIIELINKNKTKSGAKIFNLSIAQRELKNTVTARPTWVQVIQRFWQHDKRHKSKGMHFGLYKG